MLHRLLKLAETMKVPINKYSSYSPTIIFVHNKVHRDVLGRNEMLRHMYAKIFAGSELKMYKEQHLLCFDDIEDYNEQMAMMQTLNMYEINDCRRNGKFWTFLTLKFVKMIFLGLDVERWASQ